ncbi:MAG: disulfide bond formation protein DsbA [Phormidium sp. GEM2.Bin31]|nr:MAG: disulfide bond formation protein DsbA [Phormidium sp. GEM2.Bin31]
MSGTQRVRVNGLSQSLLGMLMVALLLSGCQQAPSGDLEAQVLEIIRENPEVILESVQAYQQEQQRSQQESRGAVVQQMRENPAQFIGESPVKGAAAQEIVMIEFSDFQCPFCARASGTVAEFIEEHGDRVTLVFKHLPLVSINPQSLPAARASWAAQQQGQFWEYHQALFENQERLGESLYLEIAEDLNLDLEQFERDRESEAAIAAVQTDLELADQLGLTGTPTFFINGESFTGAVPLEEMEAVLAQVTGESQ